MGSANMGPANLGSADTGLTGVGSTQRAIRVLEPLRVEVVEVEIPKPAPLQVLVRIESSSICGMHELKVYKGLYKQSMWRGYPSAVGSPGHEGAGTVVGVGDDVTGLNPGDRVVMTGLGGDGLHAQYVVREAQWIEKLAGAPGGKELSSDEAAPAELVACLVNAFNHAGLLLGKAVAVSGLGAAGLLALQLARASGSVYIAGVDVLEDRLCMARELGADEVFDPRTACFESLRRERVDVVFDCSGSAASIQNSFFIAREQVILFGYTDHDFAVDQSVWFHSELSVKSSGALGKRPREVLRTAVKLLELGRVSTRPIITHTMPLGAYLEALKLLDEKKAIKVVLHPWED